MTTSTPKFRDLINIMRRLTEAHGIEGLPGNARINDRGLEQGLGTPRYRLSATPYKRGYASGFDVRAHPDDAAFATSYQPRSARADIAYYDPELSDLDDEDADEPILHRRYAKPKANFVTEIEPLPGDNI